MQNFHPSNGLGAVDPVSAGIQLGTTLLGTLLNVFGVGKQDLTKIHASNDANAIETQMALLSQQWDAMPHTTANQQAVVSTWYQLWNQLVQMCSDPTLGTAGGNCIKDRQRGGKWDWFAMHLDPILNTPLTDSGTVSGDVTSVFGSSGMLIVGGLLIAVAMFSSDN